MSTGLAQQDLAKRAHRDAENARRVAVAASAKTARSTPLQVQVSMVDGVRQPQLVQAELAARSRQSIRAIAAHPFHAMVEVDVETAHGPLRLLWYANEDTLTNEWFDLPDGGRVTVLSWTHPGFQVALASSLGECERIGRAGYALSAVTCRGRAKFSQVVPSLVGIYEPGGAFGEVSGSTASVARKGMKAVKLDMTLQQVRAFAATMRGFLLVTGAPGTGKTTVAFQRMRYLFDQQESERDGLPPYEPELTRVFLANANLLDYSRNLLRSELAIPVDVVSLVSDFIHDYIDGTWTHALSARQRSLRSAKERRAREAALHLCRSKELSAVWTTLERQVSHRISGFAASACKTVCDGQGSFASQAFRQFASSLAAPRRATGDPANSGYRMDAIYDRVRTAYDACRATLNSKARDQFDDLFAKWLFEVFDPLSVLAAHFGARRREWRARVLSGVGAGHDPDRALDGALQDWSERRYAPEDEAWIAWLLRFSVSERSASEDRFRGVPVGIPHPSSATHSRWSHIVIDEAQDLSVAEASLLSSFVHPQGALTVSADFHQVVSPVHGMTDTSAFSVGLPIHQKTADTQFPFTRNLRQSLEIGRFLQEFYRKAFQASPTFEPSDRAGTTKPALYTGAMVDAPELLRQLTTVLSRSKLIATVAIIQVNDDDAVARKLRLALAKRGIQTSASPDAASPSQPYLTTAERAKGLEFDACVVLGLEDLGRSALNFAKNRAYVALSRAVHRLFIVADEFPRVMHGISKDTFDRHHF